MKSSYVKWVIGAVLFFVFSIAGWIVLGTLGILYDDNLLKEFGRLWIVISVLYKFPLWLVEKLFHLVRPKPTTDEGS